MPRAIQTFEVSLKAFVVDATRLLLLREADSGWWELPGGRIDVGEEWVGHDDILAREITEELGAEFRIEPTAEVLTWVRRRPSDGVYQFVVGRLCRHVGGTPRLSEEHIEMAWVDETNWRHFAFPPTSDYPAAIERFWRSWRAAARSEPSAAPTLPLAIGTRAP